MLDATAIAASEFTLRRAAASRKVAQRELTADQANALVLPWLAIACRAGADLPDLAEPLADLADYYTEAQRRAVLADEICPRPKLIVALTAAWLAALKRVEVTGAQAGEAGSAERATPEQITRAHGLQLLLRLFTTGPLPLPPRAGPDSANQTAAPQPQGQPAAASLDAQPSGADAPRPAPEGAKEGTLL